MPNYPLYPRDKADRDQVERRVKACYDEAICFCKYGGFSQNTKRCLSKLDRILSSGRSAQNPYSGRTCKDLKAAIKQRGLVLPKKPDKRALLRTMEQDDTQRQFRFTDLPAELRVRVYKFAFRERQEFDLTCPNGDAGMVKPALLRASRQIHHEASQIFFRQSCFVIRMEEELVLSPFTSPPLASENRWLNSLSSADISDMRSISVFMRERIQIDLTHPGPEGWLIQGAHEGYACSCSLNNRRTLAHLHQQFAPAWVANQSHFLAATHSRTMNIVSNAAAKFKALCGEGAHVKPNIEGLEILVEAAASVVMKNPAWMYLIESVPPSTPIPACCNFPRDFYY